MMRRFLRSFLCASIIIISFADYCRADEPAKDFFKKELPIEVYADHISYDRQSNTYLAGGDVVIIQGQNSITADRVILDMSSNIATATGNVRAVDEGGNTLSGDVLTLHIEEKTAVVVKGRLFFKEPNVHLWADLIRKTGPQSYDSRRATFTTCDCPEGEDPPWSFYISSSEVTVGEYLTGWHAFFNIKGVPVFYSPYVRAPVKRERQTGFLPPKPGFSRLRGFKLDNSFFWAISRNSDATFYLDVETRRGTGKGMEFRYIRKRDSYGELYVYHFKEKDIDRVRRFRDDVDNLSRPETAGDDRWRLRYSHRETLPLGISFKADINMVSDDEYFIDFGKDTAERSFESLESTVSFTKSWSLYSLVVEFRRFDNLLLEDDSKVLQRLPEITFTRSSQNIPYTPFYISFDSNFVNFERFAGPEGQRVDLRPKLSLPLRPGGYFEFTTSITPRGTFYWVKRNPEGRYIDRYIYEVDGDLNTTLVRVFSTGLKKVRLLRHTIRPRITYKYIPEAVQEDLPGFDSTDTIKKTNKITYSLNTILTGKFVTEGKKTYHDYIYLDVSQSFDINEATRKLTSEEDERRPFSDVKGEAIVRPSTWSTVTARGTYDPDDQIFKSYDTSLALRDRRGDDLYLTYRYIRDSTSYFELSARLRLVESFDLTYYQRYSFRETRSIESRYGAEYRHQCWGVVFSYTERLEEKLVYLSFSLRGIGPVAGVKGRIERE